jgi:hypothetical protein
MVSSELVPIEELIGQILGRAREATIRVWRVEVLNGLRARGQRSKEQYGGNQN